VKQKADITLHVLVHCKFVCLNMQNVNKLSSTMTILSIVF